ncbi:hypothetical protein [Erythrobacter longus]|nr:hypothetical protein [Erythrobacter longus]
MSGALLCACDAGGADGPGSVSVDEAQALDEAAEMLDERRLPEGVLAGTAPETAAASEQGSQEAEEEEDE